ncbi:HpcH/HpaI aldolase/citrate lyase family protein [Humitalea sp. 24SJ18S-53]|uniref:HpcH/HpaI aldolase/citrate lyase family protein n=1 Tax=Humitalea sp. 24SJ18S-53 TaxID=3422307 RepID=UPI003D6758AA
MTACRTFLFAPGDHARRAEKALSLGADAAILDLEDAVALSAKIAARDAVNQALALPRTARAYVRVNAFDTPFCYGDIAAVVGAKLDGIVLPKLEDTAQLIAVDWMMGALERERGLPVGGIDLIPIIETARGHAAVRGLAAAGVARMRRMAFGAADYTLDLGITWTRDEAELAPVRSEMVLASRAAGLDAPIDTVWAALRDAEGFAASCARGAGLGFQGRMCIHPDQVPVANAAYSPTEAEIAWSQKVSTAFADAEAQGLASIQVEGRFVDYPIVDRARRVLALAARLGSP